MYEKQYFIVGINIVDGGLYISSVFQNNKI